MKRPPFKRRAGAKTLKSKSPQEKRRKTLRKAALGKKPVARSAVPRGPARDEAHLAKVRRECCLVCDALLTPSFPGWFQWGNSHAHHPRELFPRSMGKRISDHLAIPVCDGHHSDQSPLDSIHKHNTEQWWRDQGIDVRKWIKSFSEEGRKALEALERMDGSGEAR